jgi:hypothetical protein
MIASILAPFRKPTQARLVEVIQESIQLEKLKLLEAKQAKDFADTDIAYREKRIASLMQSLKEEKDAQTLDSNAAIAEQYIDSKRAKPGSAWDIARSSVSS